MRLSMFVIFLLAPPLGAQTVVERFRGLAYEAGSEQLAYIEEHERVIDASTGEVMHTRYLRPDGSLIAKRQVRFGADPLAPDFELKRADGQPLEGGRRIADDFELYRTKPNAPTPERATVDADRIDVADAGFVELIRTRFDELRAGRVERFAFAVPARLGPVAMQVRHLRDETLAGRELSWFRLELQNGLLRLLVDPIEIAVDRQTRALAQYRGISNMAKTPGKNYVVRIEFESLPTRSDAVAQQGDTQPPG